MASRSLMLWGILKIFVTTEGARVHLDQPLLLYWDTLYIKHREITTKIIIIG